MWYSKPTAAKLSVVSLVSLLSFGSQAVVDAVGHHSSENIDESNNMNPSRRLGGPLKGSDSHNLFEKAEKKKKKKGKMPFAEEGEVTLIVRTSNKKGGENASKRGKNGKAKMNLEQNLHVVVINVPEDEAEARIEELQNEEGIMSVEYDIDVFVPEDLQGGEDAADDPHHSSERTGGGNGASNLRRRLAEEIPYGINMVNAEAVLEAAEAAGMTPDPVTICIVDTGYDRNHEDLPTNVLGGYSPYGGQTWFEDGHGHGTHVAGTIGAVGGNNLGVVGVNPDPDNLKLFIAKGITDSGSGSLAGIMDAVNSCVDNGAKVISMSLGWGYSSGDSRADVFKDLYNNNDVLTIAAAGNSGKSNFFAPASFDGVMSVAANDWNKQIASFSTFNSQVEISGPGVNVLSTLPGNRYAAWSGTSMATPHVAGVAGLLWGYFPACTNHQIRGVLQRTADDRGDSGCDDNFGYGIVEGLAAFNLLRDEGCEAGDHGTGQPQGGCVEYFECDSGIMGTIELTTDKEPKETSWDITNSMDDVIAQGSGFTEKFSTHTKQFCKETSGCAKFTIRDTGKKTPGICCKKGEGSYTVTFDGEVVGSGGSFDGEEEIEFGCTPVTNSPTKSPSTSPSTSPVASPSVAPFASPSMSPSMNPTISHAPISPPTTESPTAMPSRLPSTSPTTTTRPSSGPSVAPSTSNVPTPSPNVATWEEILSNDFESGWGDFDGGKSAKWENKGKVFKENGKAYVTVKGNFPTSEVFTDAFDVSSYSTINVIFGFYFKAKEDTAEFVLEYEINEEATWSLVQTYEIGGSTYENKEYYNPVEEFAVPDGATSMRIRFRMSESSDKKGVVYFDDVVVSGLTA